MANYCEICGKKTATGFNVSHSHLKTKRTWKPNIQRVRVLVDGQASSCQCLLSTTFVLMIV
jgi:large subunit ribosomal protein L28